MLQEMKEVVVKHLRRNGLRPQLTRAVDRGERYVDPLSTRSEALTVWLADPLDCEPDSRSASTQGLARART